MFPEFFIASLSFPSLAQLSAGFPNVKKTLVNIGGAFGSAKFTGGAADVFFLVRLPNHCSLGPFMKWYSVFFF